jgi:hypothetical protein
MRVCGPGAAVETTPEPHQESRSGAAKRQERLFGRLVERQDGRESVIRMHPEFNAFIEVQTQVPDAREPWRTEDVHARFGLWSVAELVLEDDPDAA